MIAEPSRSVVDRGAGVEDTRAIFPSGARAIHVTHKPIYRALGIENVKHRHGAHKAPSAAINGLHANPSRVSELYEALIAAGAPRWQVIGLLHRFGGYQVGKTFLVDRLDLIRQLEEIAACKQFEFETVCHERVVIQVDKTRKYRQATAGTIPLRPLGHLWPRGPRRGDRAPAPQADRRVCRRRGSPRQALRVQPDHHQ